MNHIESQLRLPKSDNVKFELEKDLEKLKKMFGELRASNQDRFAFFAEMLGGLDLDVVTEIDPEDKKIYPIWISNLEKGDSLYIKQNLLASATSEDSGLLTIKDFTGLFVVSKDDREEFEVLGDGKIPIKFWDGQHCFDQFSVTKYFSYLESFSKGKLPTFGCTLLYSPRIGSTQTTFDK